MTGILVQTVSMIFKLINVFIFIRILLSWLPIGRNVINIQFNRAFIISY